MGKTAWIAAVFFGLVSFFLDKSLLAAANSIQNSYITWVMSWLSNLLTVFVVLIVMSSLFMLEQKKARWLRAAWVAAVVSLLLAVALKEMFMRTRPLESAIGTGILLYAFPSAHAAVAFSLVPVLDREFKRLKLFWIIFAVLVCFSRIYLGAHYLSDVVWGGILGFAIGSVFLWMETKNLLSWKRITHSR
jgi:undecaprenyl-diphosphatase